MIVWSWILDKFTESYCHSWLSSEFIQTQKSHPNLKTGCYIKLKFFFWTKLLENLLLAKYIISVAPSVNEDVVNNNIKEGKYCSDMMKKNLNKEILMTEENNEDLKIYIKCWICDNVHVYNDIKVRDPCQTTGKNRGSTHRDCKTNVK